MDILEKINKILEVIKVKDEIEVSAADANDWGKRKGYNMTRDYRGRNEDLVLNFYKNNKHVATWFDGILVMK